MLEALDMASAKTHASRSQLSCELPGVADDAVPSMLWCCCPTCVFHLREQQHLRAAQRYDAAVQLHRACMAQAVLSLLSFFLVLAAAMLLAVLQDSACLPHGQNKTDATAVCYRALLQQCFSTARAARLHPASLCASVAQGSAQPQLASQPQQYCHECQLQVAGSQ